MYALLDCTNYQALATNEDYRILSNLAWIEYANVDIAVIPIDQKRPLAKFETEQLEKIYKSLPPGGKPFSNATYSDALRTTHAALLQMAPVMVFHAKPKLIAEQAEMIAEGDDKPYTYSPGNGKPRKDKFWRVGPQRNRSRMAPAESPYLHPQGNEAPAMAVDTRAPEPPLAGKLAAIATMPAPPTRLGPPLPPQPPRPAMPLPVSAPPRPPMPLPMPPLPPAAATVAPTPPVPSRGPPLPPWLQPKPPTPAPPMPPKAPVDVTAMDRSQKKSLGPEFTPPPALPKSPAAALVIKNAEKFYKGDPTDKKFIEKVVSACEAKGVKANTARAYLRKWAQTQD